MLSLEGRRLNDISILEELIALEILSLKDSYLKELPQELRKLSNLRFLNLSTYKGTKIPPNVISGLSLLEELYVNSTVDGSVISDSVTTLDASTADVTYLELYIRHYNFLFEDFANLEYLKVVGIKVLECFRYINITITEDTLATKDDIDFEMIELWKKPQYIEQLKGPEIFKCLRHLRIDNFGWQDTFSIC